MYAVIETGGKQYKVKSGSTIYVEKLDQEPSTKVKFDKVLLVAGEGEPIIGKPYVENATVSGTLVDNIKDDKVIVFKFKRKTGYRKKQGHRQQLSQVTIEEISTSTKKVAKAAKKDEAAPEKKAAVKKTTAKKTTTKKTTTKKAEK